MAKEGTWDFECPQFVDFVAGLDHSAKDDVFFDCKDHHSPVEDCVIRASPVVANENFLTEEAENRLLQKMTAALSMIETPRVKKSAVKGKLLSEKFPTDECPQISKFTIKPLPRARLHRSKSVACLNRIITEKARNRKECGLRKRSSSLCDLRDQKKAPKYPVTPMCLKRTIIKAKTKTNIIKSSEEIELEKIAKLQKQLIQHLRDNEMTLKKLGLRSRSRAPKKQSKPENLQENKGLNTLMEKLNIEEKDVRQNNPTLNLVAIKNKAMKVDSIINRQAGPSKIAENESNPQKTTKPSVTSSNFEIAAKNRIQRTQKTQKTVMNSALIKNKAMKIDSIINGQAGSSKVVDNESNPQKSMLPIPIYKPSVPSVSSEVSDRSRIQETKKTVKDKKPGFHSGLTLQCNIKKNTIVQPFSFDSKINEPKTQNPNIGQKSECSKLP